MIAALLALPATGVRAQADDSVTVDELRQELAQRDAIIVDLLNRVRALEQRETGMPPEDERDTSGGRNAAATVAGSSGIADPSGRKDGGRTTDSGTATDRQPRTGSDFDIDAAAAERALERGLVQEGARLLGPGQLEFEPAFAASLYSREFPTTLPSGSTGVVGRTTRISEVRERRANLRIGLPWQSQVEIGLPYVTVGQTVETEIDGIVQSSTTMTGSGAGDATVGLSRVLASESGARPNLIGRLTWLSGNGAARDGAVVLGGGFSGVNGRLSAYWRRDPVVFLVSGGYTRYGRTDGLEPGDSLDVSLGLGLAISPDTALIFSLNQISAGEFARDGIELVGTNRVASTLDFTVSTTLGRRLFFRGFASAGLTDDAADYGVGLSLTSRFDTR